MTQRLIGPSGSKKRRLRLWWLAALTALAFGVFFVSASSGTLSGGSTFESGDGNLVVNGPTTTHDWNNPVETISCGTAIPGGGANCGLDLIKSGSDNSLGQGSKEDDPNPTVVSGQIPPSKDDLSRFYVNKEKVGGNDYLYMAWERSNLLGSAHMDFEFNQSSTLAANGVTTARTAGDLLIDFDFGGSGVPVLAKHTWITSGSTSNCEASNTLPCWDKAVVLGASAEAAVNSVPVQDTNAPGPNTLDGNTKNGINSTFGEAAINLTGANIFPANQCTHFGSATLKSRSSGNSFTSELKDFIAPVPVNISNCGAIVIHKQTTPDGASGTFSFTHDITNSTPVVASPFTLSDNGEQDFNSVLAGTYHITESATTGFDFASISCTVTGSGGSSNSNVGAALTITLHVGDTVDCTFNNTQRGTIVIKKVTVPATDTTTSFSFAPTGTIGTTGFNLLNGGTKTYSNVVPGSSNSVNETVPTNWVLTSATCDNGNNPKTNVTVAAGGTTTCTFTNTLQLGAIKITKESIKTGNQVLAGAKFSIKDPNGTALSGSPFTTDANGVVCVDGLALGNYKVQETAAPAGYTIDDSTESTVAVTGSNAKCTDASFAGEKKTFFDTPKTDLLVKVTSQDSGAGGSNSSIKCIDGSSTDIGNSPVAAANSAQLDAKDLAPGTYSCTVVIDP